MANYYINGTTLSNSTAIFTDEALTICAANGFYADSNGITRALSSCVLGAIQTCPSCATTCNNTVSASGGQGVYTLDIDVGNGITELGAVKVRFFPAAIPDGFRATFNGTVYNQLSSIVDGRHASTTAGNFTYVGDASSDCGISGVTYSNLTEFNYTAGAFSPTGNTRSISVAAGDVSLTPSQPPGECVMVIPKLTSTPNIISFEFVGPCTSTAWSIVVDCPVLLTGYDSSTSPVGSSSSACGYSLASVYYNMPVNGASGAPDKFDWVFADVNGENILANGFYKISGNRFIEVADGIIVDIDTC